MGAGPSSASAPGSAQTPSQTSLATGRLFSGVDGAELMSTQLLRDMALAEVLGDGRFLKSHLYLSDEYGRVVVRTFRRVTTSDAPTNNVASPSADVGVDSDSQGDSSCEGTPSTVEEAMERMVKLHARCRTCRHVLAPLLYQISPGSARYVRPYVHRDVRSRCTTRPFLTSLERRWVAYQLLNTLAQLARLGVVHGDVTSDNVLLTSDLWLYIADFSTPYKPSALPADHPALFAYYFDSGGTRRCAVAPERFVDAPSPSTNGSTTVTHKCDAFSAGCVIAELLIDGKPLFEYHELLAYRRGTFDPMEKLDRQLGPNAEGGEASRSTMAAELSAWRRIIALLLTRDPESRGSTADALAMGLSLGLFPVAFEAVHDTFEIMSTSRDPGERLGILNSQVGGIISQGLATPAVSRTKKDVHKAHDAVEGQPEQSTRDRRFSRDTLVSIGASVDSEVDVARGISVDGENTPNATADASSAEGTENDGGAGSMDLQNAIDLQHALASLSVRRGTVSEMEKDGAQLAEHYEILINHTSVTSGDKTAEKVAWVPAAAYGKGSEMKSCRGPEWVQGAPAPSSDTMPAMPVPNDTLPKRSTWEWAGDWRVDNTPFVDAECPHVEWVYRESGGWATEWSEHSLWKQRRWVRPWRFISEDGPSPRQFANLCHQASTRTQPSPAAHSLYAVATCSALMGAIATRDKMCALELLAHFGERCESEELVVRRCVPYAVAYLSDSSASVRALAMGTLMRLLSSINFDPSRLSERRLFIDYLFPALATLSSDASDLVRVEQAKRLGELAASFTSGDRQRASSHTSEDSGDVPNGGASQDLRVAFVNLLVELYTGCGSVHDASVRRMALPNVLSLCASLGANEVSSALLPLFITTLNDRPWESRRAFFEHAAHLAAPLGIASVSSFLLPCIEQALNHEPVHEVVTATWQCMSHLVTKNLLRTKVSMHYAAKAISLAFGPKHAVHHACLGFLATLCRHLGTAGTFAFIAPMLPDLCDFGQRHPKRGAGDLDAISDLQTQEGWERLVVSHMPRAERPIDDAAANAMQSDDTDERLEITGVPIYSLPSQLDDSSTPLPQSAHKRSASDDVVGVTGLIDKHEIEHAPSVKDFTEWRALVESRATHTATRASATGTPQQTPHGAFGASTSRLGGLTGPVRAAAMGIAGGAGITSPGVSRNSTLFRPRGTLVANLCEHRRRINAIASATPGRPSNGVGVAAASFFLSASDDGTVKVWDGRRLEKDLAFASRATFDHASSHEASGSTALLARVLCCTVMDAARGICASGTAGGELRIWHVDATNGPAWASRALTQFEPGFSSAYTGLYAPEPKQQNRSLNGGIRALFPMSQDVLAYTTARHGLALHDVRAPSNSPAMALPFDPSGGAIEHIAGLPYTSVPLTASSDALLHASNSTPFLVTGSSRGMVEVWDVRYGLSVYRMQHPKGARVDALALCSGAHAERAGLLSSDAEAPVADNVVNGLSIYVSHGGSNQVLLYDLVGAGGVPRLLRVFRSLAVGEPHGAEEEAPQALSSSPVVWHTDGESSSGIFTPSSEASRTVVGALLPSPDGSLLTGGSDCSLRLWDGRRPMRSYMVAAPRVPSFAPGTNGDSAAVLVGDPAVRYEGRMFSAAGGSASVVTEVPNTSVSLAGGRSGGRGGGAAPTTGHADAVTSLAWIEGGGDTMLASGDREGLVKVWR